MILWCRILKSVVLSILLTIPFFSYCQELKFSHLTPDEGMFSGNVRAFLQDYQGFLWVGTDDGLYRYDGYEMVAFKNEKDNPSSLSDNFVLSICEDSRRNLWIGTFNGGLSLYDREKNNFRNYLHDPDDAHSLGGNSVRIIYEDNHNNLFVGSNELSYFNLDQLTPDKKIKFTNITLPRGGQGIKDNWVSALLNSYDDKIWVGMRRGGILAFDYEEPDAGFTRTAFQEETVQYLFTDSHARTWVGTWEVGVSVYDRDFKKTQFKTGESPNTIPHNLIASIQEDKQGNIWIATDGGLSKFEAGQDPFFAKDITTYRSQLGDEYSLLSDPLKALYFDRQNRMWVGSYSGGINMYDPNLPSFHSYRPNLFEPDGLSNGNVSAFIVDKKGRLWIGTDGGGLNVMTSSYATHDFSRFEKIDLTGSSGQKGDKIKCLTLDDDGNIWIGTWGTGLFKLNPDTRKYAHFGLSTDEKVELASNDVMCLQAEGNNIWIGHFNGGLTYYNHDKKNFKSITQNKKGIQRINSLLLTNKPHTILAAHEQGGLNYYSAEQGFLSSIEGEPLSPHLSIRALHNDKVGNLWAGSAIKGLIKYNYEDGTTKVYGHDQGLTNYQLNAILEDANNNLWISTNQGLFKFDPLEERFTLYTKMDGLQGNQYNPNSAFILPDGLFVFGGIKGLDYFHPEEIKSDYQYPEVVFTGFWLNDKKIGQIDSLGPLKENIVIESQIDLNHFENSFSLEFAAIDFTQSKHIEYQYILEGLNERWQHLGTTRKVSFTDLKPATYYLKVKASNREKQWSENFKTITIVIHPAWWQTSWFKIGLILGLFLAGFGIHRIRLNYLIKQKKTLEELVALRTNEMATLNKEVLAQNEELIAQNDHISAQRIELEEAQKQLKSLNENLEVLVEQRALKLEQTISKLDKTLRELDRFVYSTSHELGAPLKSIMGLLSLAKLEKDPALIEKCHHYIAISISRLEVVIKNMVDFSRNSHLKVTRDTINLQVFVNEIIEELKFWPEAENVSIVNKVPAEFIVQTDPSRMKMILHNVIGNSIKYADHSKSYPFVEIKSSNNGKDYFITVADNGIGIDKKNHERVFDMFFRAHERSTGSGLGLFIVKETVAALQGTISIDSDTTSGTTFTIQLLKN